MDNIDIIDNIYKEILFKKYNLNPQLYCPVMHNIINNHKQNDIHGYIYAGDINLCNMDLKSLTEFSLLNIVEVIGDFNISHNNLTSLDGCPEIINGDFKCNSNYLPSLRFGPKNVGFEYSCRNNDIQEITYLLSTLEVYIFDCSLNPIRHFDVLPIINLKFIHDEGCTFNDTNNQFWISKVLNKLKNWFVPSKQQKEF